MKIRPLILNGQSLALIAQVRAYAEANRISLAHVRRTLDNPTLAAGSNPRHNCVVPVDYFCTFSIEEQPIGWCRHLSVSVPEKGRGPNEHALELLMKAFGMYGSARDACLWLEDLEDEGFAAINVVQPLDDTRPAYKPEDRVIPKRQ